MYSYFPNWLSNVSGHSSDTKADVLVQWRSYSLHHELHAYSRSCRPEINERELEGKESTRMCGTRKSFYSFYFVSLYKIIYLDAILSISYNISKFDKIYRCTMHYNTIHIPWCKIVVFQYIFRRMYRHYYKTVWRIVIIYLFLVLA